MKAEETSAAGEVKKEESEEHEDEHENDEVLGDEEGEADNNENHVAVG